MDSGKQTRKYSFWVRIFYCQSSTASKPTNGPANRRCIHGSTARRSSNGWHGHGRSDDGNVQRAHGDLQNEPAMALVRDLAPREFGPQSDSLQRPLSLHLSRPEFFIEASAFLVAGSDRRCLVPYLKADVAATSPDIDLFAGLERRPPYDGERPVGDGFMGVACARRDSRHPSFFQRPAALCSRPTDGNATSSCQPPFSAGIRTAPPKERRKGRGAHNPEFHS
jgi:hypothetical protein